MSVVLTATFNIHQVDTGCIHNTQDQSSKNYKTQQSRHTKSSGGNTGQGALYSSKQSKIHMDITHQFLTLQAATHTVHN